MDTLYAPLVTNADTLENAIRRMVTIRSKVLVVQNDNAFRIYSANRVFETYSGPALPTTCANLTVGDGVDAVDLTTVPIPANAIDFEALFESMLVNLNAEYGVLYPFQTPDDLGLVLVVSRRERLMRHFTSQGTVCVCLGEEDTRHTETGDPTLDGQNCHYCRNKYYCV